MAERLLLELAHELGLTMGGTVHVLDRETGLRVRTHVGSTANREAAVALYRAGADVKRCPSADEAFTSYDVSFSDGARVAPRAQPPAMPTA